MIFFDLDHTLLDLEGADKRALPRYRETSVLGELLPWERFYEAWETIRKDCFQRYLDGEYSYNGQRTVRMQRIHRQAGIELGEEEALSEFMRYHEILRSEWKLFPEAREALNMLSGQRLGLITNGNATQQRDKLRILGLEGVFSPILTAAEAGCAKPDPQMFRMGCEMAGVKPEECFYVGDSYTSDIEPAQKLGMTPVWVDRKGETLPKGCAAIHVDNLLDAAEEMLRRIG